MQTVTQHRYCLKMLNILHHSVCEWYYLKEVSLIMLIEKCLRIVLKNILHKFECYL